MFKKPSKRQSLIRRIIYLAIASLAVVAIVALTVLSMLGFRLDSNNGRLEQGALLQFDSLPGGALVWVDGNSTGSRTASKRSLPAGTHSIKMTKDKYEDWSRTITIQPGTLTWLNYTRLVPKERTPESVMNYAKLSQLEFSPNKRWALAHTEPTVASFDLLDLRSEQVRKETLSLPETSYSELAAPESAHQFTIKYWNPSGRYVLIQHSFGGEAPEWIVVDTENIEQSVNITQSLSFAMSDIRFAGSNGKQFYALGADGTIRELDLSSNTISRALVSHVSSFSVFDTTIVSYVGTSPEDPAKKVVGVYRDGDEVSHILRTVNSHDIALHIATGKYYDDDYVAIAEGNVVTILKGRYPSSNKQDVSSLVDFAEMELPQTVQKLSFNGSSELVVAQTSVGFSSYEIEHRRTARAAITGTERSQLSWLDDAYLWNVVDGKLVMRDFDNANIYNIASADAAFDASLSTNGRFFYMVNKTGESYQLQRVKMNID